MAERSFPFDGPILDTAQWARLTAALAGDGVVPALGAALAVTATAPETLAVDVGLGDAFVRGRHYQVHDNPVTVPLAAAHPTNPRIDRIVVRLDTVEGAITAAAITGTPATVPTAPALTQDPEGIWELPLRQVFVRANATSIRASNLADGQGYLSTDERAWSAAAPPAIRLYVASDISLASGIEAVFGTATVDYDYGAWAAPIHSQVRTVPIAGLYEVYAQCRLGVHATGIRQVSIRKNVTSPDPTTGVLLATGFVAPGGTLQALPSTRVTIPLAAGDNITCGVVQNSGSSLDRIGGKANTFWEARWVRPL